MSPSTDRSENGEFATELKFLVTPQRAGEIQAWAEARLDADPHGGTDGHYLVTSLYFDTEARDVYARKGSFGRSKYRVRRYGNGEVIFVERKMKRDGRVGKTRSIVAEEELERLTQTPSKDWAGYWFHRRLQARCLEPVCQISYRRMARAVMSEQGPIRLTIDSDVRAVACQSGAAFLKETGRAVLERHIVEIKFRGEMPAIFQEMCRRFLLTPQAVSKYRMAAAELGLVANRSVCRAS